MTVRNMFGRHLDARHADDLFAVLAPLPPRVLAAMAIAAESGKFRRWSWYMCPLGRAGRILGHDVRCLDDAARALEVTNPTVERFLAVWDHLPGTRRSRTLMLKAALDRLLRAPAESPPPPRRPHRPVAVTSGTPFAEPPGVMPHHPVVTLR